MQACLGRRRSEGWASELRCLMLIGVRLRAVQIICCVAVTGDGGKTGGFAWEVRLLFFQDCIAFRQLPFNLCSLLQMSAEAKALLARSSIKGVDGFWPRLRSQSWRRSWQARIQSIQKILRTLSCRDTWPSKDGPRSKCEIHVASVAAVHARTRRIHGQGPGGSHRFSWYRKGCGWSR